MSKCTKLIGMKKGWQRAGKYVYMRPLCNKCNERPAAVNMLAILDIGLCQSAFAIIGAIATIGAVPKTPNSKETIAE